MKEFALIFRLQDISDFKPSPAQMQERMNWLASIVTDGPIRHFSLTCSGRLLNLPGPDRKSRR